ncbi:hypothetical protein HanIR_Chr09g0426071 [Helianthus annuus]|nr:hypothetical protein HanIR_Chr09g0426071 [Helianthus annuus]
MLLSGYKVRGPKLTTWKIETTLITEKVCLSTHTISDRVSRHKKKGRTGWSEWTRFDIPLQVSITTIHPRDVSFHEETQPFTRTLRKV